MGLLTDPGVEGGWLSNMLMAHHKLLATLFYVVGTCWFLALAHNSMNHGTYFSENALLPGLVQGEFMGESRANRFLQELLKETEKYPSSMPHSWLLAKLTQLGLDTYTHNFTLNYPMVANKRFSGENVYGILRAVRSSSTESIVVSAPYRPPDSVHHSNAPAIALMLALAHFFAEQVYWAKDIIFLISEHEQLGVEAWLQAYHGTTSADGVLEQGVLSARAGPIQAAVNLEISASVVSHVDIRYEGLNGQLPNLDLVNLLHRLCHRENVKHTIKNRHDHPRPESMEGWLYQLGTLATTVATQASGVPSGNHGLFHRYGIAAVTVSGEKGERSSGRSSTLLQLGRVLEGTCRSLNNLLERFHQSFFFYLLPATNRYISIGVYMPAFGAVGCSLLLVALALWCSSSVQAQQQLNQEKATSTGHEKTNGNAGCSYSLVSCCSIVVVVHAVCLAISWSPRTLALSGTMLALAPEDSVAIGLAAFALVSLRLPGIITRNRLSSGGQCSWEVLKCIAVLELSVLVFAGAVHNFSLALIVTVVYTPVVLLVAPSASRLYRWLKAALLLLVHPLSLLVLFVSIDTWIAFSDESVLEIVPRMASACKRALMYSVVDALVYENWVFPVGCSCLLPVWMLLWHVLHSPIQQHDNVKLKTS
uniref:GPI-anchor transamidase component GPAA1 n=1 Tax=Hirondellea gigas TaxID=1518452 RepID=A0A2P2HZ56_9CRUS